MRKIPYVQRTSTVGWKVNKSRSSYVCVRVFLADMADDDLNITHLDRVAEEPNELSVTEMTQLEEELSAALMHTRLKKVIIWFQHGQSISKLFYA